MAKKITAWEADDGSLHKSEFDAIMRNKDLQREGSLHEIIGLAFASAGETRVNVHDVVRFLINNWPHVECIVKEYKER